MDSNAVQTLKSPVPSPLASNKQEFLGQKYCSVVVTFDEALVVVNDLVLAKRGRYLSQPEILIMRGAWHNREFVEIAENSDYSVNYLQRGVATRLWDILTKTIGNGKQVSKKNVRNFLEQVAQEHYAQPAPAEEKNSSVKNVIHILGGKPPNISNFYGRTRELSYLKKLITKQRCVSLVGGAGIGKTALAAKLIQEISVESKPKFDSIIWKSVAHGPLLQDLVAELLELIRPLEPTLDSPKFTQAMISALIKQMQLRRCLLVLDESDSLFETNNLEQQLEYKLFFRRLIEEMDQTCLLLTNRVFPDDFEDLIIAGRPIQDLKIKGLDTDAAMQLLFDQGLNDPEKCNELIKTYYGNPLELKTVVTRIHHFFGGSTKKFFENKTTLFSSQFQAMLDKAFSYLLSENQRQIMIYVAQELALNSKPILFTSLLNGLNQKEEISLSTSDLITALEGLEKQSLIETIKDPASEEISFTLQPIVKKYIRKNTPGLVHTSNAAEALAIAS
ncbi:ATP-binding protein [Komarekiella sp. 'clone 1']|uniref:ATP-binding protein n=1 Tax=Komarekiella delphini-convector SJRDD-AB1 TaxID=2593771 RepID=A0AA40VVB9_9NOST|nr:ATP-binding protein [Komarekiella delphini-convector]MBD6620961.1 ATP-binding protein [Komarekiella delphini-convector SJRDD-AB1]